MKHHFFFIPVYHGSTASDELNALLAQHPTAQIERHFVADGNNSAWAVCCIVPSAVSGLTSSGLTLPLVHSANSTTPAFSAGSSSAGASQKRIDYRDVLEPEIFARFAVLRDLRNRLAKEEGIPAYAIFSNQQLAEIAQLEPLTKANMGEIDGIGNKRIERYSEIFINTLEAL